MCIIPTNTKTKLFGNPEHMKTPKRDEKDT